MGSIATRDAYGRALVELGSNNTRVVVLDADLSKSTKTADFAARFPDRFFNLGVAEQNLLGTAAGLALGGKIPFASSFAIFATGRAYEQIRNSIAYPFVNVKIAATHAGLTVGEDGGSHQSLEDIGLMRGLPGMTVLVPADAEETRQMVLAMAEYHGPVYLRLGRSATPVLHGAGYRWDWGKAEVLRPGNDVTVMAIGIMVAEALAAATQCAQAGIDVQVINVATIKPLDHETVIKSAQATGALVTVEEHSIINGLGSAVAEVLGENCPVPMERVGVRDTFGESGKPGELLVKYGLTAGDIVAAIGRVVQRKRDLAS